MEQEKAKGLEKSNFAFELFGRITSFLDPKRIIIILALAIASGLLGLLVGTLFVENEYRTTTTMAMVSRNSQSKTQNLSDSHHVADVMQALYDNDSVISATLEQMGSDLTVGQFVKKLSVKREEKTVLVKISYTATSEEEVINAITIYTQNLTNALKTNLGYDCFNTLVPPREPVVINHTLTVVILAVVVELLAALIWVIIRVFPGVIIITGKDLNGFNEPILGEVFEAPMVVVSKDGGEDDDE